MRGGKRKGAGRKPKYNEPTKIIRWKVPISLISELKKILEKSACK